MVKSLLAFLILVPIKLFALNPLIDAQVSSLLDRADLVKHKKLIEIIFEDSANYIENNKSNSIAIIKTLKENGLLKLFFKKPRTIHINFSTGGNAQFFVKLMRDTLRSIGYYRYFTTEAQHDNSSFIWSIEFNSEYAIDPIILQEALQKRHCSLTTIERKDATHWDYDVDISEAKLFLKQLQSDQETLLNKSLRSYWIDISKGKKLSIFTRSGDAWFPDIAIFDAKLRLIKVYKRETRTKKLVFYLPKESAYMSISDMFHQSNIKHGLRLLLEGEK